MKTNISYTDLFFITGGRRRLRERAHKASRRFAHGLFSVFKKQLEIVFQFTTNSNLITGTFQEQLKTKEPNSKGCKKGEKIVFDLKVCAWICVCMWRLHGIKNFGQRCVWVLEPKHQAHWHYFQRLVFFSLFDN